LPTITTKDNTFSTTGIDNTFSTTGILNTFSTTGTDNISTNYKRKHFVHYWN